jgi:hypothetical protein
MNRQVNAADMTSAEEIRGSWPRPELTTAAACVRYGINRKKYMTSRTLIARERFT